MNYIKFEKIDSTNNEAKKGTYDPWTVLVADEQTQGHGKIGEKWFSPNGGLYFSIVLPKINIDDLQTITILAAFCVAKIIKENYELEPLIKLPNDVLVNNKKICGVLTENIIDKEIKLSVIGIGLNTNTENFPKELKNIATSIKLETNKQINNKNIMEKIVLELKNQFKSII
jgi:BirA family transcriptional regulator, biotin operon repressor / biotin---[acetyl-CoA-carboxylase] ligase